jgi:hypothetical protein
MNKKTIEKSSFQNKSKKIAGKVASKMATDIKANFKANLENGEVKGISKDLANFWHFSIFLSIISFFYAITKTFLPSISYGLPLTRIENSNIQQNLTPFIFLDSFVFILFGYLITTKPKSPIVYAYLGYIFVLLLTNGPIIACLILVFLIYKATLINEPVKIKQG